MENRCKHSTRLKFAVATLFFLSFFGRSQELFYADCFKGGVVGDGYTAWFHGGISSVQLPIPISSSVKRAFLFCNIYSRLDIPFIPTDKTILINNNEVLLSSNKIIGLPIVFNPILRRVHQTQTDITDLIDTDLTEYIINPLHDPIQNQDEPFFSDFYILVLFENYSFSTVCIDVILNSQQQTSTINYTLNYQNTLSSQFDVGLAIHSSGVCNIQGDRYDVFVNNNFIGPIGGQEENTEINCAGVIGSYQYYNGTLIGIGNDNANESMHGLDAIANIQTYLSPNSPLTVRFDYGTPQAPNSNLINQLFLTYTSPCQPFDASLLTSDTTTCAFVPMQLGASGGNTSGAFQAYEWLPQENLSCYDCPNPIFLGDSTTNYTVRIRNTDSCSVVYPVRVRVLPNPRFESIEITESVCGGATGSIAVASSGLSQPHSYVINDGLPQNNGTFNNLASGSYTITLTNEHGCSVDSTVFIGEFNNVQAAFSVNPTTGTAPLDISITNQSQNATEYFWDFTDEDGNLLNQVTGHFGSAQCPVAGVYTLTLVAGNGAQHCNDTTSVLIVVKEPFVVFAYTHVTNEANVYQVFFSGVSEYDYKIYALDGKLVYQKSGSVESAGHVDLWEISKVASGMYVFRIKVKDSDGNEHEVDGKLMVVR